MSTQFGDLLQYTLLSGLSIVLLTRQILYGSALAGFMFFLYGMNHMTFN